MSGELEGRPPSPCAITLGKAQVEEIKMKGYKMKKAALYTRVSSEEKGWESGALYSTRLAH